MIRSDGEPTFEGSSPFDRILLKSLRRPLNFPARYVAALLLVLATSILQSILVTDPAPWLLYTPVVMIVALTMGGRTGVFAVLISAMLAGAPLARSDATLWLALPQLVATGLFVAASLAIVALAASLRSAFRRNLELLDERRRMDAILFEQERRTSLLGQELAHRLKNLLAVVQLIADQTLRRASDLNAAGDALTMRLAAIGRATDVLTAANWSEVDLHELVRAATRGHASQGRRFRVEGPSVRCGSQGAMALTLAFHELVTNAVKYGALSTDAGSIDLSWSVEAAGMDAATLRLTWAEFGGPTVVPPPRRGFGSFLIEEALRRYLRGRASMDYRPTGLVFRLEGVLSSHPDRASETRAHAEPAGPATLAVDAGAPPCDR